MHFQRDHTGSPPQPIPAQVETVVSEASTLAAREKVDLEQSEEKKADNDSITGEIIELRTEAVVKEHSEWVWFLFYLMRRIFSFKHATVVLTDTPYGMWTQIVRTTALHFNVHQMSKHATIFAWALI